MDDDASDPTLFLAHHDEVELIEHGADEILAVGGGGVLDEAGAIVVAVRPGADRSVEVARAALEDLFPVDLGDVGRLFLLPSRRFAAFGFRGLDVAGPRGVFGEAFGLGFGLLEGRILAKLVGDDGFQLSAGDLQNADGEPQLRSHPQLKRLLQAQSLLECHRFLAKAQRLKPSPR
mgnify:CR=1 FL=1